MRFNRGKRNIPMKRISVFILLFALAITSSSFKKKGSSSAKKKTSSSAISKLSRSMVFPVAGKKSKIGSFWGDVRDGGERSHEGIDIFAKKGTPVVAVCDGIISSRGTFPRGGKILWLQSSSHPWSAYYAHLDQWKVKEGQYVRKGQVLGTVGNTGNARSTPSHLHFGIYSSKGAVNPLPYVRNSPKIAAVKVPQKRSGSVKTKKSVRRSGK